MGYQVVIRQNATGIERTANFDVDSHWDGGHEYLWSDGNYGCDCNRAIFFHEAGNEKDPDIECGETEYDVVRVIMHDGTVIEGDPCDR